MSQTVQIAAGAKAKTSRPRVQIKSGAGFDLEDTLQALAQLQQRATEIDRQFTIAGRIAMIDLMARVYRIWHAAKTSDRFAAFVGNIKSTLQGSGVELKESSKDSGMLVRYVFMGTKLSPKQIHVYGRSLDVAWDKATPADGFADLVNMTNNGFEGLRAEKATPAASGGRQAIALSVCRAEPSAAVSEDISWHDGEDFQILLAVKDDAGKANLKYVPFSKEQRESMLIQIHRCIQNSKKPAKAKKPSKVQRDLLAGFEAEVEAKGARVRQLEIEVSMAATGGEEVKARKQELEFARHLLAAAQATVATVKASFGL